MRTFLNVIIGVVLFAAAAAALHYLYQVIRETSVREIHEAIKAIPRFRLLAAGFFVLCAYITMTAYDMLGLRWARSSLSYSKIVPVSLIGDIFNANIGFSALVGSAIKFRLYTRLNVPLGTIIRAIAAYTTAYWAGVSFLLVICRLVMFFAPNPSLPALHSPLATAFIIAASFVSILYLAACCRNAGLWSRFKLLSLVPRGGLGIKLFAVAILEWLFIALAFFVLLPATVPSDFPSFSVGYLFSHVLGIASQAPGGLGVFDSGWLLLNKNADTASLLGSLAVFRLLFYVIPFCCAACFFLVW
ncbi:MAG: hypothetical protein GF344_08380, partial [Chitinivibrionales bacterium]|nr:hypothetical protein [Chitinivibrionales bacterium]MBD3356893.1 hypothetical protein [Chitinivibrionales bacterium]